MYLIAWLLRSGQTRLVSRLIESCRTGSHHRDVPVYPRCPKEREENVVPDWEGSDGVSQPRAREVPSGMLSRRVNRFKVVGFTIGEPRRSMHRPNCAMSGALEN